MPLSPEQYHRSPDYDDIGHSGWAEWQPRRRARRSHDSMYSARGRPALSDCDEEEVGLPQSCTPEEAPLDDYDEPFDPVSHLGDGIPPYNFDLFSEVSSKYAPNADSFVNQPTSHADFYNDEEINKLFGGASNFYDSYTYSEEEMPPQRRHRFEDDPIIPDYNFDLFSDVTNRWAPSPPAARSSDNRSDHDGRASTSKHIDDSPQSRWQTSLVLRRRSPLNGKPAYSISPAESTASTGLGRVSTFEVEEYNGTDEEGSSIGGCNDGNQTLVSATQQMIDCEVISNPEDAGVQGLQARRSSIKCR
ncbi:hypothetical protein SBRCBS47491_001339 [Sporothrix bragantina]|uniref:Uncharacterized protein n=1 Tax=Sporothrix bragantina TaxID=671064 RepID=A0ABP0AXX9_9PEZI